MRIPGLNRLRVGRYTRRVLSSAPDHEPDINYADWKRSLADPAAFYLGCYRYFHRQLPDDLRAHRQYFQRDHRGFGEDVFHTMWFLLFREFQPKSFLEIGVYRGQILSLLALLQKQWAGSIDVTGISPFTPLSDSVSRYMKDIDYLTDTLQNFERFNLPPPQLVRARSTDREAVDHIASRSWDCIYIDGGHDYETVKADWKVCSRSLVLNGIIVLDDAALYTSYRLPQPFNFKGHPGPSRVADEVDRSRFREILQVGHNRVFQKQQC